MQAALSHIKKELEGLYPYSEIESFFFLMIESLKKYSRSRFLLKREEILTDHDREAINKIVGRLKVFEPIQYVLGKTEFYGLKFWCQPGVLIPRPETEELVNWVVHEIANPNIQILDIGTGTGCIPIAIKNQVPQAKVFACDISEACIELARQNAARNHADVSFFRYDIFQKETEDNMPKFDLIISNPPYVCESEKPLMHYNVLKHEPELALFVPDDDPLVFYQAILNFAENNLVSSGKIYLEINEAFGLECVELLKNSGYKNVILRKDINGKDRMVSAQKI